MNADIEKLLRNAPGYTPPPALKERLIQQIPRNQPSILKPVSGGWLRRWWPALAPAAVSVACAVVLTAQKGKIREMKANIEKLSKAPAIESTQLRERAADPVDTSAQMEQEINRLKELVSQLKAEIGQLQQLQTQNTKLRSQVAAPPELELTPELLAKAQDRRETIECVNNLKQFGLAVRTWALDNNESNPPNVLSMSNELSTPKILVCPADTNRLVAADWTSFTMANCSYEFLIPDEKDPAQEPMRVTVRCPIHGNIGLCDGSVQSRVGKEHPNWLVERDGKIYFAPPNLPNPGNGSPTSQPNAASPGVPNSTPGNLSEEQMKLYRERYGIKPTNEAPPQ